MFNCWIVHYCLPLAFFIIIIVNIIMCSAQSMAVYDLFLICLFVWIIFWMFNWTFELQLRRKYGIWWWFCIHKEKSREMNIWNSLPWTDSHHQQINWACRNFEGIILTSISIILFELLSALPTIISPRASYFASPYKSIEACSKSDIHLRYEYHIMHIIAKEKMSTYPFIC